MKIKKTSKRATVNQRSGFIYGKIGLLAKYGYFTPQVQKVVRRWQKGKSPRIAPECDIQEYFLQIAPAALWMTRARQIMVHCYAHWLLVWELGCACDKLLRIPKEHPHYWLLFGIEINLSGGKPQGTGKFQPARYLSWNEIAAEIVRRGGPDFDQDGKATVLRQSAKRLKMTVPAEVSNSMRQK